MYLILLPEQKSTSARAVYKVFDTLKKPLRQCTGVALNALKEGNMEKFFSSLKNDLTEGALTIVPEIYGNIYALKKAGAPAALMTGSGSCAYGVFADKKSREKAYRKLKVLYASNLIKAQTVLPEQKNKQNPLL